MLINLNSGKSLICHNQQSNYREGVAMGGYIFFIYVGLVQYMYSTSSVIEHEAERCIMTSKSVQNQLIAESNWLWFHMAAGWSSC